MNIPTNLTHRYLLLRAEMRRRLAVKEDWASLPGLLDEMHRVRSQQRQQQDTPRTLNAG